MWVGSKAGLVDDSGDVAPDTEEVNFETAVRLWFRKTFSEADLIRTSSGFS